MSRTSTGPIPKGFRYDWDRNDGICTLHCRGKKTLKLTDAEEEAYMAALDQVWPIKDITREDWHALEAQLDALFQKHGEWYLAQYRNSWHARSHIRYYLRHHDVTKAHYEAAVARRETV